MIAALLRPGTVEEGHTWCRISATPAPHIFLTNS